MIYLFSTFNSILNVEYFIRYTRALHDRADRWYTGTHLPQQKGEITQESEKSNSG